MDPRRDPHRPITTSKQLLVEGRTAELFFECFTAHLRIQDLEIRSFVSVKEFNPFVKAFCARPEFKESVQSLGIIRDAEFILEPGKTDTVKETASRAFQSVCSGLEHAGQPKPGGLGIFTQTPPRIGVFILPNCEEEGMLETLCLKVVAPNHCACIDAFFQCMEGAGIEKPGNMTKARTYAYLATQDIYDPLVGRAAQKGVWPWENPIFDPLRKFLRAL